MQSKRLVGNFEGVRVRIEKQGNEFWFVAKDVAEALRFTDPRNELIRLSLTDSFKFLPSTWDNSKFTMIEFKYVLELAFKAEEYYATKFLHWLYYFIQENTKTYDNFESSEEVFATTQIAKSYGLTAIKLNEILFSKKVQYKVNDQWVLYEDMPKNLTKTIIFDKNGKQVMHTYWTKAGVDFISNILSKMGMQKEEQLQMKI